MTRRILPALSALLVAVAACAPAPLRVATTAPAGALECAAGVLAGLGYEVENGASPAGALTAQRSVEAHGISSIHHRVEAAVDGGGAGVLRLTASRFEDREPGSVGPNARIPREPPTRRFLDAGPLLRAELEEVAARCAARAAFALGA